MFSGAISGFRRFAIKPLRVLPLPGFNPGYGALR